MVLSTPKTSQRYTERPALDFVHLVKTILLSKFCQLDTCNRRLVVTLESLQVPRLFLFGSCFSPGAAELLQVLLSA